MPQVGNSTLDPFGKVQPQHTGRLSVSLGCVCQVREDQSWDPSPQYLFKYLKTSEI